MDGAGATLTACPDDHYQAVLPGVTVIATHEATGITRETVTINDGNPTGNRRSTRKLTCPRAVR